jgi:hypothetical protein
LPYPKFSHISLNLTNSFFKRKASPEPGSKPNWGRVKVQPSSVSASEFAPDRKGSKTQVSPQRAYDELRVNQREAIDRVIEDTRRNELNPFAEWKLAFVKANKSVLPGTFGPYKAWETTDIRLILKRAPRQTPLGPISPLNKYGRIIDTSEPPQQVWQQTPQMIPQQQQQHLQQQQHPQQQQQFPPPPQQMMGPGNPLPPPPMHPPPGPSKGQAPQILNVGGGGNKKHDIRDKNDKKSNKGPSRGSSPTPFRKETKTVKEKVTEWDAGGPGRRNDNSDDSDDDSSIREVYEKKTVKHKISKDKLHGESNYSTKYEIPRPPMGKNSKYYVSGGNHIRHPSGSPPPHLLRKSSLKETRRASQPYGKRLVEKRTIERYADSDDSSDRSYVMLDRRGSSVWSDRESDYTDPSSLGSRDSRQSRKYRRDSSGNYEVHDRTRSRSRPRHRDSRARSQSRLRSRSRPRRRGERRSTRDDRRNSYIRDERRASFESRGSQDSRDSRESRESYRKEKRRDSYREHSKPEAYRGISPDSDSTQGSIDPRQPVHVHIHHADPAAAATKQYPIPTVQALPIRGSQAPISVQEPGRIMYEDDPAYRPWLASTARQASMAPVRAPMVPSYEEPLYEQQRRREDAAKLYVESERRRSILERSREVREDEAVVRAREERERWERQRNLDDLKREEARKKRDLDDLDRETERKRDDLRRRDSVRYESTYSDRPYLERSYTYPERSSYEPVGSVRDRARRRY